MLFQELQIYLFNYVFSKFLIFIHNHLDKIFNSMLYTVTSSFAFLEETLLTLKPYILLKFTSVILYETTFLQAFKL